VRKLQRNAFGYVVGLAVNLKRNFFVLAWIEPTLSEVERSGLPGLHVVFVNLRGALHSLIRRDASGNRQCIVLLARDAAWIRRRNLEPSLTLLRGARRLSSLPPLHLPCSKRLKRFLPLHLKPATSNIQLHLSDVSILLCLGRLSLANIFGNPTKRLEKVRSSRRKKTLRGSKPHRIKHAILAGIKGLRQFV
jgi:hypothetical protein